MSLIMHTLHVDLDERSYPIYIGRDLLADRALMQRHLAGQQVVLVSNDTVAPLYMDRVREALGEQQLVSEVILPDGEQHKTMASLNRILDTVLEAGHNRSTTLIALGGGVVGDITGFAAACYQRGVGFLQIPTTLLAQVDSSVGGKTAVNHPLGKNMIGAFYQPRAVFIDLQTLHTLPEREYAAGLAEVIKYGLLADEPFYRWLQAELPKLQAREESALAEAVERSCALKAEIVARDEREGGVRALLNLGHTFGHAIETAQGYGEWLHGEAVAAGMVLALRLSAARGWIDDSEADDLVTLLQRVGLPVAAPGNMSSDDFLALMHRDKKVIDGQLRLIVLRAMGAAEVVDDVSESELRDLFDAVS